jgi:hypothetical protein
MLITITHAGGRTSTFRPSRGIPWAFWAILSVAGAITSWGNYWLAWMLAGFLAPELYTVITHIKLGPLSDNVWHWESLSFAHPFDMAIWTWPHWTIAIGIWILLAWLSVHMPFGIAR